MAKDKKPLGEGQKWMISLWSALLFLIIASPFMFKNTGWFFSKVGLKTQQGGCPNWWGLIIHAIVFALLIRVMMLIPLPGTEEYNGLASPASMARCNAAYLVADREGCNDCTHAAQICMKHPHTNKCKHAIAQCNSGCHNQAVANMTARDCDIYGHVDYYPRGCLL
jgi:hypothetical protein